MSGSGIVWIVRPVGFRKTFVLFGVLALLIDSDTHPVFWEGFSGQGDLARSGPHQIDDFDETDRLYHPDKPRPDYSGALSTGSPMNW